MELLLVLAVGIVLLSALATILDVTLNQSSRTLSRVDATQRARTTLSAIESQLQSACLSGGVTPIQPGSTSSNLIFLSAYGNAAQPIPVEHQLSFSPVSGVLSDSLYGVAGGSAPNWTFASTPYAVSTLLRAVAQAGSTPVFQYFAYQPVPNGSGGYYSDGAGNPYELLVDGTSSVPGTSPPFTPAPSPLFAAPPSGLSAGDARSAAEVLITLNVGPSAVPSLNANVGGAPLTVTDGIVLRLTPAPNSVQGGASFLPCQ